VSCVESDGASDCGSCDDVDITGGGGGGSACVDGDGDGNSDGDGVNEDVGVVIDAIIEAGCNEYGEDAIEELSWFVIVTSLTGNPRLPEEFAFIIDSFRDSLVAFESAYISTSKSTPTLPLKNPLIFMDTNPASLANTAVRLPSTSRESLVYS
jgi:hypothetical protein